MYLHANAKLGLAGRLALVRAIEEGLSMKAAAAAFSVSPATAHRWWHRWLDASEEAGDAGVSARSLEPAAPLAAAARAASSQERDLRLPPRDRLGAAAGRGRDRVRALDGLEGAPAGRDLAAAERRSRSRPTATSGPAPAICCTWTSPLRALPAARPPVTGDRSQRSRNWMRPETGSATTTRTRSSTTTRGSPTSSSTTTREPRP